MMPMGPSPRFALLLRMVSGVGPFASRISGSCMRRLRGGARWSFSLSGWCLPYF